MIEALVGFGLVAAGTYGWARSRGDLLLGGKADKKKPSDFDKQQLKVGTRVEMEHTSDRAVAREIAMDHLTESPDYYRALAKMEKGLEKKRAKRKRKKKKR